MAERRSQHRHFGVLDIGSGKIAAAVIVAEQASAGSVATLRIAGLGVHKAKGIKAGVLTDLDAAEAAIRAAIGQAERAAGVTMDSVTVSVACGRLRSQHFTANANIDTGIIQDSDLQRLMAGGRAYAERDGRMLVHMNRIGMRLDGAPGTIDPRGLAARTMAADLHAVTADDGPLRNLLFLIDRCYLACDGLVAAPYASALAVTTQEERDYGVTCIDFGAGTTSFSIFADGRLIGADVVPVGSQHITFDIAKALQTPLVEAERIKTLYGTLTSAQSDDHETFSYPLMGEDDAADYQTTKAHLSGLIRPRVAQILTLVRERLALNPASALAGENVVVTGGASQLLGLVEFAAIELGRSVRLGRPLVAAGLSAGLSDTASTPQLATVCGLALAAVARDAGFESAGHRKSEASGYLGRVGSWLKAGF